MDRGTRSPFEEGFAELLAARAGRGSARPLRLIVLGDRQRGDDGAAAAAVPLALAALTPEARARVAVRETGQLDPADLVELPEGGAAIVVDAVVGVTPGVIVVLPLDALPAAGGPTPRSSHVLPVDQLVALATALRGTPPPGVLVGVGASRFGIGEPFSPAVAEAVARLASAVAGEIERLVALHDAAVAAALAESDVARPDAVAGAE